MKISRVEAIPYAIPYRKPLRFASGEVLTAEHVLVRVHTDDGVVGTADAPPRPFTYGETQTSVRSIVADAFGPAIVGTSILDREVVLARLNRTVGNPVAKAAVDMAIWDAIGQTLGTSVTELLGGWTDRLRVSHMVGFAPAAEMVAEAERMRDEHGVTTFKVKVGRRPYRLDVDACRALREALGSDVELYVDGNRGWTASEAARALEEMADLGLSFAEELCPADDVLGRRWLVQQATIPMFADESVARPGEVTRELLSGAATGISIKTSRTGFTTSQRLVGLCEGLGVEVVIGNQIDSQVGSLCAAAFGAAYPLTARRPAELSNFLDMTDDLLAEPLVIEDGELRVRQGPGLGIEIDDDKLARYRQDRDHHQPSKERSTTMTQQLDHPELTEQDATAAASGANATAVFRSKAAAAGPAISKERVDEVATAAIRALHDVIREKQVTYTEYDHLKSWLIQVGLDGEWPLFLDVWLEHVVEEVANADRQGSKGTIEGPYYVPESPELPAVATLPMRDDEPGTDLVFQGQVRSVDGAPLGGAVVDIWHADDYGFYSQFAPSLPEWLFRGRVVTDEEGRFAISTKQPAPYQIPTDGSCGRLIDAAGWHAWRPAHIHLKVSADGHQTVTSQLYFEGGEYVETDIADAVKPELMLAPTPRADGQGNEVTYDFVLDPAHDPADD